MSVTLSATDVRLLGRAATAILAPEAELPLDAWRLAVNASLQELVQGDFAVFGVATADERSAVSADRPPAFLQSIASIFATPADTGNVRGTSFGLEVLTLERVVAGAWDEYSRDWAVNEVFRPNGMSDLVSISLHWNDTGSPGSGACMASVYRDQMGTPRFGEVGATLFELLLPAFRSAIGTRLRAPKTVLGELGDITSFVDATHAAVMVLDSRGEVLHESSAFTRLIASDADATLIRVGARRAGMCLVSRLHVGHSAKREAIRRSAALDAAATIRTRSAAYHVRAAYTHNHTGNRIVLVSIERDSPTRLDPEFIRSRFGLTSRQIEVAQLLAAGHANDQIARDLRISPSTARRHTEQVLLKLGVERRAAVGPRLRAEL